MAKTRLCAVCKAQIEPDRIDGMPDTQLCTEHGRQIAKYGGEFKLTAEQERTSKPGSLKLNYGGIATTKTRNTEAILRLEMSQ